MRHIINQPFIFATGLAALVHSTWSLATLFSGNEPMPQFSVAWFSWLIPALLIAFALDVGQIITSAEIRAGNRTVAKYLTFVVLAAFTYYFQWTYLTVHIPALEFAPGVAPSVVATILRDAAVWITPLLLPLSTTLYTFSYTKRQPVTVIPKLTSKELVPVKSAVSIVQYGFFCPECGKTSYYGTQGDANKFAKQHATRMSHSLERIEMVER